MRSCLFALLLSTAFTSSAMAAPRVLCTGDAGLDAYDGHWADARLWADLAQSRAWAKSILLANPMASALRIHRRRIEVSLGWHETDTRDRCVRVDGTQLRLVPLPEAAPAPNPYVAVGRATDDEAHIYLGQLFKRCFRGDDGARWCLTPDAVSIDGRRVPVKLQLDLSEGPLRGTPVRVEGEALPFWVFVPRPNGWDVFRKDWDSAEPDARKPQDTTKPWRRLRK